MAAEGIKHLVELTKFANIFRIKTRKKKEKKKVGPLEKGGGLSRKIHTGCVDKYIILGVLVAKSTLFVVASVGRESPPFLETQICFVFRYFFKESRALALSDDDHGMATKPFQI